MIIGIIWAVAAGIMLGLYALPAKFTKEFEFENTWGTFFTTALFIVPLIVGFSMIDGFGQVLKDIPTDALIKMGIASILWGVGVMFWGKAINHIGLSLGFSIFIGTVILVGSLLPFIVDGLPATNVLVTILGGILVVLLGIIANGRAGLQRQKDEGEEGKKTNMGMGILIAVGGGLLATGFSFANAVGIGPIKEAVAEQGNPEWMAAIAVMFVIYVAGGLFVTPFFIVELTRKKFWGKFKTVHLGRNLVMTTTMAILNFAASAVFAYAAYALNKAGEATGVEAGNTVGYAIFNALSVVVAIVGGLLAREWIKASSKAKNYLYLGLGALIMGVVIIAIGNSLGA